MLYIKLKKSQLRPRHMQQANLLTSLARRDGVLDTGGNIICWCSQIQSLYIVYIYLLRNNVDKNENDSFCFISPVN